MSGLVEETCQVRVTETPKGPATFYHWDETDSIMAREASDIEMQTFFDLYEKSVVCGQPAFDFVYFREERVWMCFGHYAKHQGGV
jgi:hypothetical protein